MLGVIRGYVRIIDNVKNGIKTFDYLIEKINLIVIGYIMCLKILIFTRNNEFNHCIS